MAASWVRRWERYRIELSKLSQALMTRWRPKWALCLWQLKSQRKSVWLYQIRSPDLLRVFSLNREARILRHVRKASNITDRANQTEKGRADPNWDHLGPRHYSKYFTCIYSFNPDTGICINTIIISIEKMKKLKHKDTKLCDQVHTSSKWGHYYFNQAI